MTSPSTISRWISKIRKYVYVKSPKGYYRTLWAKLHPKVKEAVKLYYRGGEVSKTASDNLCNNEQVHTQKCISDCNKSAIRLTHKCATTNNTTNKETTRETTAPPSPLPAGGPAPAVLIQRKQAAQSNIERFGNNFGSGKSWQPPSEQEFENRRQQQQKALGVKL